MDARVDETLSVLTSNRHWGLPPDFVSEFTIIDFSVFGFGLGLGLRQRRIIIKVFIRLYGLSFWAHNFDLAEDIGHYIWYILFIFMKCTAQRFCISLSDVEHNFIIRIQAFYNTGIIQNMVYKYSYYLDHL